MGLGRVVKKAFKGIKKVFKKVLKPFAKILSNKWVKGIMMGLAVVGGITAFAGAFSQGLVKGMQTIGSNLMTKIQNAGKFVMDLPKNIATQAGKVKDFALGSAKDATIEGTQAAASTVDAGAAAGDLAKAAIDAGVAQTPPMTGAQAGQWSDPAKGLLQKGVDKVKGAGRWAQDNPMLAKTGMDMVAAATAPDSAEDKYLEWQKAKYNARNKFFSDFSPNIDVRGQEMENNQQGDPNRALLSRRSWNNLQPTQYATGGR